MITSLLLGVLLLCTVGAWASFTDSVRQSPYYIGLMAWVSVTTGFFFAVGAQYLNDKPKVFVFSLAYDVAMVVAYYVFPVLVLGVHLKPGVLLGAVMIVLGFLVIHLGT